jgi:hypothetical protein
LSYFPRIYQLHYSTMKYHLVKNVFAFCFKIIFIFLYFILNSYCSMLNNGFINWMWAATCALHFFTIFSFFTKKTLVCLFRRFQIISLTIAISATATKRIFFFRICKHVTDQEFFIKFVSYLFAIKCELSLNLLLTYLFAI